jgi:hypothetical protein
MKGQCVPGGWDNTELVLLKIRYIFNRQGCKTRHATTEYIPPYPRHVAVRGYRPSEAFHFLLKPMPRLDFFIPIQTLRLKKE